MGLLSTIYGGPLTKAVNKGDVDEVALILRNGGDPNEKQLGISVLMNACNVGNTSMVKLLLEQSADANAHDWEGMTPLMMAVVGRGHSDEEGKEDRCLELVKLLIDAGANVDYISWRRRTALKEAEWAGNSRVVQLLKEHGAKR